MTEKLPNGYYWYTEDGESEPCEVKPDGIYDVYFIGREVGNVFDELEGTLEPLELKDLAASYKKLLIAAKGAVQGSLFTNTAGSRNRHRALQSAIEEAESGLNQNAQTAT